VVAYDFKRERFHFSPKFKMFFFIDKKSKETVRQPNKKIRYHEFGSGVLGEELKAQVDLSSIGLFDIFFNICCHRGNAATHVFFVCYE
jgi:hypothetical protein